MTELTGVRSRCAVALLFALTGMAHSAPAGADTLRICADPNNPPFSDRRLEGFENKLADLVAADFGATTEYTWMPQRRGFIRRTLNARTCDVVMGVPTGYEPVLSTKPYYRSSYVFAYAGGKGLELHSFDDPELRHLKIGLQALVDDRSNPPPAHALARRGIVENITGFMMWDADSVGKGTIDVAIVWGPLAGYFAKRQPIAIDIVSIEPPTDDGLPFAYDVSMGVRRSDAALRDRLDEVIARRHDDIDRLLASYGVPLVAKAPQ